MNCPFDAVSGLKLTTESGVDWAASCESSSIPLQNVGRSFILASVAGGNMAGGNISAPVIVCNVAVHSVWGVEVDNIPWRKRDSINKNLMRLQKAERERESVYVCVCVCV